MNGVIPGWGQPVNHTDGVYHFWDEDGKSLCSHTHLSYIGLKVTYENLHHSIVCDHCENVLNAIGKGKSAISDVVSPDAPVATNEKGGMQSHAPVRFDLIDAKALFATAAVLHEGAEKYAPGNWRLIPVRDHLNHLLMHTYAYLSGDRTDDHLSHAVCRAIFALAVDLDPDATPEQDES